MFCIFRSEEVGRMDLMTFQTMIKCADAPGIRLPFNHNLLKQRPKITFLSRYYLLLKSLKLGWNSLILAYAEKCREERVIYQPLIMEEQTRK